MSIDESDSIYAPPSAELAQDVEITGDRFLTVSSKKLVLMYILTFGLYFVYWFYKNWKLQQNHMNYKINPIARTIFSVFFTHSLFRKISDTTAECNIKINWNSVILASIYIFLYIFSGVVDAITVNQAAAVVSKGFHLEYMIGSALFVLSVFPLLIVQDSVNRINQDVEGTSNSSITLVNILFILIGLLLWTSTIADAAGYLD